VTIIRLTVNSLNSNVHSHFGSDMAQDFSVDGDEGVRHPPSEDSSVDGDDGVRVLLRATRGPGRASAVGAQSRAAADVLASRGAISMFLIISSSPRDPARQNNTNKSIYHS